MENTMSLTEETINALKERRDYLREVADCTDEFTELYLIEALILQYEPLPTIGSC